MAALSTAAIGGLSATEVAAQIGAFKPAQVAAVGTDAISGLSTTQVTGLSTAVVAALTTAQIVGGLTSTQVAVLKFGPGGGAVLVAGEGIDDR